MECFIIPVRTTKEWNVYMIGIVWEHQQKVAIRNKKKYIMDNLISNTRKIYQDLACGIKTIKYEFYTRSYKDYPIRTLYIQDTKL